MPDETQSQADENTPIPHRALSNRAMPIILVLCILAFLILIVIAPVTCGPHGHPRWVQDLSNVRQAGMVMITYAVENDGQFPQHIKRAEEYWAGDEFLISPIDQRESLAFDETIKTGWYSYGSYWFLTNEDLTLDLDKDTFNIMIVYRTPRPDHDAYIVGFMDGHVETLTREEFKERKDQQARLISESGE